MKMALLTYYLRINDYPTKYSLAALRLGEYLYSSGIDVEILPIALVDLDFEKFVKENINGKYDIVGISNYVWSRKATPKIAKIIRENAPETSIIIGGPEVRYTDLEKYKDEIFILGEGEESLVKTVKYIEDGKKDQEFFSENPNIFDKNHPDRAMATEKLVYKSPLFSRFKDVDKDFLYYETSRGCAYRCGYCGFRNLNMFNMYAPYSKLTIYLRPEFVDDEMVDLLNKANLKEVRIGIQTINKNIPAWIRSNSIESVCEQLPKLSKAKVPWKAEFIIGLPGDDMQGLTKSLDFAEKVLKPTEICCYPLTLIKDTPLYDMVNSNSDKWVKIDKNGNAYESFSYTHNELIEMQEYAKYRMNKYLKYCSNLEDTTKKRKIEQNKNIYKDVR